MHIDYLFMVIINYIIINIEYITQQQQQHVIIKLLFLLSSSSLSIYNVELKKYQQQ